MAEDEMFDYEEERSKLDDIKSKIDSIEESKDSQGYEPGRDTERLESIKSLVDDIDDELEISDEYPGVVFDEEMSEHERELRKDVYRLSDRMEEAGSKEQYQMLEERMWEKVGELEEYVRDRISEVRDEKIEDMGIDRTEDGRLKLYHVTPVDHMEDIVDEGLRPRKSTGNYSWGLSGEDDGLKDEKVYLAHNDNLDIVSGGVQSDADGRSVYILEVEVDEENLYPDEDTKANHWVESMDLQGVAAYKGEIDWQDIRVVDKVGHKLGPDEMSEIVDELESMEEEYIGDRKEYADGLKQEYLEKKGKMEEEKYGSYDHLLESSESYDGIV